jgi:hypothetical protein
MANISHPTNGGINVATKESHKYVIMAENICLLSRERKIKCKIGQADSLDFGFVRGRNLSIKGGGARGGFVVHRRCDLGTYQHGDSVPKVNPLTPRYGGPITLARFVSFLRWLNHELLTVPERIGATHR